MKLSSSFNPAFESREPTAGVGFFETNRAADTKITRWSTTSPDGVAPAHYYVKNVPAEFQPAFQSAFDEWNAKLKLILGKEVFSYQFVPQNDPRNAQLVAGDPRFNIVEWDLVNLASYGGLGPSIANQFTGENITANVYIQGPTIINLYTQWFKVNAQAQALRDQGQNKAADVLLIQSRHDIFDKLDDLASRPKLNVSMNGLGFRVHAQRPEPADPAAQRNDFDPLPKGLSYDQYMYGYFHDMMTTSSVTTSACATTSRATLDRLATVRVKSLALSWSTSRVTSVTWTASISRPDGAFVRIHRRQAGAPRLVLYG